MLKPLKITILGPDLCKKGITMSMLKTKKKKKTDNKLSKTF